MASGSVPKRRLKKKFDPIWVEEFEDLKRLSRSAFILRQIYRLTRDPGTDICNISDLEIRRITGFDLFAIKRAREELLSAGELVYSGYHTFQIPEFKHYHQSLGEIPKVGSEFRGNPETSLSGKPFNQFRGNPETLSGKPRNSYIYTESEITERNFSEVKEDEIPSLRTLYPYAKRDALKSHLLNRGHIEAEIGKIFELVYPLEYTGKAV